MHKKNNDKWNKMLNTVKKEGRQIQKRRKLTAYAASAVVIMFFAVVPAIISSLSDSQTEDSGDRLMARQSVELEIELLEKGILFDSQLGYFNNNIEGEEK